MAGTALGTRIQTDKKSLMAHSGTQLGRQPMSDDGDSPMEKNKIGKDGR